MKDSDAGIRVYECSSWEDFTKKLRVIVGRRAGTKIYRGHAKLEWKLSSMWEREISGFKGDDPYRNLREIVAPGNIDFDSWPEDKYLRRFKKLTIGLPGVQSASLKDDRDWWALGRHYGLITPLLDWTYSPYIASYFAFVDYVEEINPGFKKGLVRPAQLQSPIRRGFQLGTRGNGPIVIWALCLASELEVEGEFEVFSPQIDFSHYSNQMRAQQSVFTMLRHDVHVDIESYLQSRRLSVILERFEISELESGKALKSLEQMNITFSSLFPSLSGAAAHANVGTFELLSDREAPSIGPSESYPA